MMTAFGARTNPIPVGGTAEFSGVLTESFTRPRVEGTFVADDLRAFDVTWGRGQAALVIQNSYVDVTDGRVEKGGGLVAVGGRSRSVFRGETAAKRSTRASASVHGRQKTSSRRSTSRTTTCRAR
jgi:hypothetical protein